VNRRLGGLRFGQGILENRKISFPRVIQYGLSNSNTADFFFGYQRQILTARIIHLGL
jgi:hypothetical protein